MTERPSVHNTLLSVPLADRLAFSVPKAFGSIAVKAGEVVTAGATLIHAKRHGAASVHSSVFGTVSSVTTDRITIATDPEVQPDKSPAAVDLSNLSREQILQKLHAVGLLGLGGASYPLVNKIRALHQQHAKVLLINAVECDDSIECDRYLIENELAEILRAIELLRRLTRAERTVLAVKPVLSISTRQALQHQIEAKNIELHWSDNDYPAGYETYLLQNLIGDQIGFPPAESGFISFNVASCFALSRFLAYGEPLYQRITTIKTVNQTANYLLPFGTPISHIASCLGLDLKRFSSARIGGALAGRSASVSDSYIDASCNSIIFSTIDADKASTPCIRCGYCSDICPQHLLPQQLYRDSSSAPESTRVSLDNCIECGLCDQVCPSHIRLTDHFRAAKAAVRQLDGEQHAAEQARQRFEQREARLKRQASREQQQLAQKQRALAQNQNTGNSDGDARKKMLAAALQRKAGKKLTPTNRRDPRQ